ncbi:hypothetical protein KBD34_00485 [Patescibacteria group bacterium]|nr:hypothetical protein [Patescibacteria group bacterium]
MDRKRREHDVSGDLPEVELEDAPWRVDGQGIDRAMTDAFRIELLALSRSEQLRCLAAASKWLKQHPDQPLESFEAIGFLPPIRKRVLQRLRVPSGAVEGEQPPSQVVDVEFSEPDGTVIVIHMTEAALRQFDRLEASLELKREIYAKMREMTEQDSELVIRVLPMIGLSVVRVANEKSKKPNLSIIPRMPRERPGVKKAVEKPIEEPSTPVSALLPKDPLRHKKAQVGGLNVSPIEDSDVARFSEALQNYNRQVGSDKRDEEETGSV